MVLYHIGRPHEELTTAQSTTEHTVGRNQCVRKVGKAGQFYTFLARLNIVDCGRTAFGTRVGETKIKTRDASIQDPTERV